MHNNEERIAAGELDRLAKFIMAEVPGEPSRSEGAVDCAMRIIRDLRSGQDLRRDAMNIASVAFGHNTPGDAEELIERAEAIETWLTNGRTVDADSPPT